MRQFKLIFMMYLGALASYSYWSQNLDGEVKPESFSQEMDGWNSYRHQTNVQTGDAATGVLQTSNAQRFIAVKTVPEWANNIK
jgi:hypothetical protein